MRYTGKIGKDEHGHIVAISYNEAGEEVVRVPWNIDNHTTLQDLKLATRQAHEKEKQPPCQE